MGTFVEFGLGNAVAAAVLALVAAGVSRLFRRPALTHTLWVLVLLKLLTPPLVPLALPWPTGEQAAQPGPPGGRGTPAPPAGQERPADPDPGAFEAEGNVPPVNLPAIDEASGGVEPEAADPSLPPAVAIPWQSWAEAVWLAGSVLWAAWVGAHVVRFRRLLRLARHASPSLREEAESLARRMGLRRCPEVWLVPGAVSPMVWGLGRRPCLLFPAGLLGRLDDAGRAALLAHELAHVRRRDHLVRLLELAATGLYWWYPALWWARRELHEAEEQCCDAWGVWAVGGDGLPYAQALLQVVAFVSQARLPLPAGASGVGRVSDLKRRLAMVMQGRTSRSLSWAGLGGVLALGLLSLPLFPARGQVPAGTQPATGVRESRDEQINVLKEAIRVLEEQKRQEALTRTHTATGAAARFDAPVDDGSDTKALQEQIQELDRAIASKAKELRDLQDKAQALRAKLKETGSQPPNLFRRTPSDTAVRPPANRVDDLEKKLDRLQKELEELRRELRPDRGAPRAGAPMRGPGMLPGGMAPPGDVGPGRGGFFPGVAPPGALPGGPDLPGPSGAPPGALPGGPPGPPPAGDAAPRRS
jgi:beta-lactamase regulating signal transducer with metallopeptidase domain